MFSPEPSPFFAPTRSAGFFLTNCNGIIVRVCALHGNPFAFLIPAGADYQAMTHQNMDVFFKGPLWESLHKAWRKAQKASAPAGGVVIPQQHTGYEFHLQSTEGDETVVYLYEIGADDAGTRYWNAAEDLLCLLRGDGTILRASPSWGRLLGANPDALSGTAAADWVHPADKNAFAALLPEAFYHSEAGATPRKTVVRMRGSNPEAECRWMQWSVVANPEGTDGGSNVWLASARDVTESHHTEAALLHQAHHDPLTDLPNRALLEDRLHHALAGAQRRDHCLAVLFLDINRLKPINDTHGHGAGDTVLREVARRFKSCLRDEDTVARLGGDEFVVVLPVVGGEDDAVRVGRKLLDVLTPPIFLEADSAAWGTNPVKISASVGISLFPEGGQTAQTLIKNADAAMYRAKKQKLREPVVFVSSEPAHAAKNVLRFGAGKDWSIGFSNGTNDASNKVYEPMQASLFRAVDRDEMRLHYQPQVSLSTGQTTGVEALLRWQTADWGMVPPATFIPLAEETGLMVGLGAWAIGEACKQGADWQKHGHAVNVSVNVSARQLSDATFPDTLSRWLDRVELPASRVDLEINEVALAQASPAGSLLLLRRLKKMGVRLSIDDWGTGSLAFAPMQLEKFPIDTLKIDRSFIKSVDANEARHGVVAAVIDWGHALGLRVLAEGVETPSQRDTLTALGCDAIQGYLVSAAVPPSDVRAFFG